MPKYKYTVIQRDRHTGEIVSTHHYEIKADAMNEVSAAMKTNIVEVMEYLVWFMGWWKK